MTRTLADLQAELGTGYRLERELGRGGMATLVARLQHPHILPSALDPDFAALRSDPRFGALTT